MSAAKNNLVSLRARTTRGRERPQEDRPAMSIVLRGVPAGHNWGWFSNEEPRMHLQTVDREHFNSYKVWLERGERRVFEPAGKVPAKVLKRLEADVQEKRAHIEGRWVNFMIDNRWLQLKVAGTRVTITAYSHVPTGFTRTFDLRDFFRPEALALIGPKDVVLSNELPAVEIWPSRPEDRRHHIRLSTILWEG